MSRSDAGSVLITGAAGFLGRYAVREYLSRGWPAVGVDASAQGPEGLAAFYSLSLPDPELTRIVARHQPDVCLHCAGSASVALSVQEPLADFQASVAATYGVLDALRRSAPRCRFIFMSSAAVYGNPASLPVNEDAPPAPLSPYGFHKLQCEQLCAQFHRLYGLPTASLRIFSAFGPGLKRQVVWDLCRKILSGGELVLFGAGQESRDFIHAGDVMRAASLTAEKAPLEGEVYNLALGRETAIAELARLIAAEMGYTGKISFDGQTPPGTPLNWRADVSRIASLGFAPATPLEDGLRQTVRWARDQIRKS